MVMHWSQAGQDYGVKAFGYKAVDALRLEKGYAALASDITAGENPYEARLGFCVKLNAGEFIGRSALLKIKADDTRQRLCTLVIGDEEYLCLYGGEAVFREGRAISRLRSAGYGHTVKKNGNIVSVVLAAAFQEIHDLKDLIVPAKLEVNL